MDLMVLLGGTEFATVYGDRFMVKGFSTLFYPAARHDGSVVWHFEFADRGEYLPHWEGNKSCIGPEALASDSVSWLYSVRHYVGWAPKVETNLGRCRTRAQNSWIFH